MFLSMQAEHLGSSILHADILTNLFIILHLQIWSNFRPKSH